MKLIVGLGNPGKSYMYTRHNIGFLTVEHIALEYGARLKRAHQGLMGSVNIDNTTCSLLMPHTMMNESGRSVASALQALQITPVDMCVIYDDFALEFGRLKVRPLGSAGGHNGMKSIIAHLQTTEFARLRVGIGEVPKGMDAADYVLGPFNTKEKKQLPEILQQAHMAAAMWATQGIHAAMNAYNSTTKEEA